MQFFYFCNCNNITRSRCIDRRCLVSLNLQQWANFDSFATSRTFHYGVFFQNAREDTDKTQLLHKGINPCAKDLSHQRPGFICRKGNFLVSICCFMFNRFRREGTHCKCIQQFGNPCFRFSRDAKYGDQRTRRDGLGEQLTKFCIRRLISLKISLHHRLIDLDNGFNQWLMNFSRVDESSRRFIWNIEGAGHGFEIATRTNRHI